MTDPRKTLKLIANPVAGGDARLRIEEARKFFEEAGYVVDLTLTEKRGDARLAAAAARTGDFERLVVAGGDGTLNEAINGLAPSTLPLAFLPLGTTNVLALEAGIPKGLADACRLALAGTPTPVALGRAGEARFLLMAGIGFDAEVVARVSTTLKRRVGKLAYAVSALLTLLRHPPAPMELCLDDGRCRTGYGAIIGNGRLYGGRFSITRDASLQEPSLDVCLFCRPGRLPLLRSALRVGLGRPLRAPDVALFKTTALTLRGEGVAVQIDGDSHGGLPMNFSVTAGELLLVLPPASGEVA
ncbi:sphingosine/diacylglycerol kinase-related protein [Desulfuromonas soudanensis]|uniref:Sphingosine/diacylglycerol kinase-related protein n=1 Tax=Desulfuromonas soudanensis TaxID=1603606 RepID=A0A0M4DFK2_9BACT|nr:diacylglycerol kinase family protein [Desulfuromonas soudanensis]ALC15525.1 sphingosine/diacylglycerol kinase-related protein [Desulfuromonas soudanensis]